MPRDIREGRAQGGGAQGGRAGEAPQRFKQMRRMIQRNQSTASASLSPRKPDATSNAATGGSS